MFRQIIASAFAAALVASPATAHHDGEISKKDSINVSHAWTVETGDMAHAIDVYMTIQNTGDAAVRLTGAETDFAKDGVFQAPVVGEDGALVTKELPAIVVKPGQQITFQPGGVHVVFNDVQRTFDGGDFFHAHLQFAEAGEMEIEVEVEHRDEDAGHHDHESMS